MNKLRRFLRKMNVQLFIAFLAFSAFFLVLIANVMSFNWNQMFAGFAAKDLEKSGYLLIDDMRQQHIRDAALSPEQRDWLQRRAALLDVLLEFESSDRSHVWLDTFVRAGKRADASFEVELPYADEGVRSGYLRLANMEPPGTLSPAFQAFQEGLRLRTNLMYALIIMAAVAFSYLFSKRMSRHLTNVYTMAEEIGAGNRDIRVPVKGPEEVRRLAATLNNLSAELKRQEDWRHHLMEDFMHELRTPLTSMLSRVEAIVDGLLEPDAAQMQEIFEELERLARLVNDLERLSEAEAARFTMVIQRTDMVKLVRRVYNQHKALAKGKGIRLVLKTTTVPCYAEIDRDKIVQVMTNIVLNAIKYTPGGGEVTLGADGTQDGAILTCADTGIGIGADDLPYIFNRLYRADKSRSRFTGGVGLGLSVAKALVEAHNGEIEAVSKVGIGSRFTVKLPNEYRAYP